MDGLHVTGNLIAYSSALLVSLLLLVLTLRAARLPESQRQTLDGVDTRFRDAAPRPIRSC